MKLSLTDKSFLPNLTIAQKTQIVYGNYRDNGKNAEVAILLGAPLARLPERVSAAAKLFFEGRVKYIVATGGVEWETENGKISEALFMTEMLKEMGIPEDAIIVENEARTTRENMLYATIHMCRRIKLSKINHVIVVTSPSHVRRALIHANMLLPRTVEVSGYVAESEKDSKDNWYNHPEIAECVEKELWWLKGLVTNEKVEDIEY